MTGGGSWDHVKDAFHAVVDLPRGERGPALDRLGLDAAARREVESLLDAHDRASSFLDGSAADRLLDTGQEFIGQHVGVYRIVGLIGAGGMGAVYHAVRDDAAFAMDVAVKIVKRGLDTDEILRRFYVERQTLARLEHPNIAKLIDGGSTADGRPYLVMEYVRGVRLDRYCDAQALDLDARLRLFITICQAVQHAHQQLVIHRDLKPDNILVTGDGVAKLVDFGIARVLAPEGGGTQTMVAERRMTLTFASPEQVRGEPMSTASDVYSLGVILYELLAGRSPFASPPASVEAYHQAVDAGFPTPRTHAGDLDAVVMKAMHADPARRYATAQQLADDLTRYLDGRPVLARPDTLRYRTAKFVRRHRGATIAGGLAAAAVVAGIAGVLWQAAVARDERDRAQTEASRARLISDFMAGVFRSADPNQQGRTVTVADALDGAVERAERDLAGQPEELATIRATIGTTYLQLGLIDKAMTVLERAVDLRRTLSPNTAELMQAVAQLGDTAQQSGDLPRAEALYREALDLARRIHGPEHLAVASMQRYLGSILLSRGDLAGAESTNRETLALLRRLPGVSPGDLAQSVNNLAVVLGTSGRWDEAVTLQREALDLITAVRGERHPETATAMSTLAQALEASRRFDEAAPLFERALALRTELLGPDHPGTASTRYAYALMLIESGRFESAAPLLQANLALRGRGLPDAHPLVAATLQQSGRVAMAAGDLAAAERDLRESLTLRTKALPAGHWLLATGASLLGESLTRARRFGEAEDLLRSSYDALVKAFGNADERTRLAASRLVALYEASGRPERAAEYRPLPAVPER